MAITSYTLEMVRQILPHVPHRPIEMLCLAYPDVIVQKEQIRGMFGDAIADAIKFRDDSAEVLRWHGYPLEFGGVPETVHFLSLLGIKATMIDIVASRGVEVIVDLNQPSPPEFTGKFDIVLDAGTVEHCFNIAQAMANLLGMAKVGGFVYHANPFNLANHGFYNLNPTFYNDFYADNGHALVSQPQLVWNGPQGFLFANADPTERFRFMDGEAHILIVAQKLNERQPKWPMQSKYKNNPMLKG